MVTIAMPGRANPVLVGGHVPVVGRIRELWQQLYPLADQIDEVEALMERQASWICRHRDRDDLTIYQAKWNTNDERRLQLHAQVEQLVYRADIAMRNATDADRAELGHLLQDGGMGMAEWFAAFVPQRDITASWCPETVNCDGHVF